MYNDIEYSVLLLSGGIGSRINIGKPKQYVNLNGTPMIIYSLIALKDIQSIKELIVNYPKGEKKTLKKLIKLSGISKRVKFVEAGKTRQESVYKMLKKVSCSNIIIHEAARPIVKKSTFTNLIYSDFKNCGYMHEIPFTVAPVDPNSKEVTGSLKRENLRNVLLPQKFETKLLKKAHKNSIKNNTVFTEDACLFVENGNKFHFIDGQDTNIKVTYKSDLILAENILSANFNNEDNR
jgi:2-C-methyl-D-erythritol 4-phosphate cytidylyltransferase